MNKEQLTTLIEEADLFSEGSMKVKSETEFFTIAYTETDGYEAFEKLVFDARYTVGLYRAMQRTTEISGNAQVIESQVQQMLQDFTNMVQSLQERLERSLSGSDGEVAASLRKKYLQLSGESFQDLLTLLADFSVIKQYLNAQKRS